MSSYDRAQFVEDFAMSLTTMGLTRMPSRIFSAVLASDSGSLTARELCDSLGVSPAAVSGAVAYLTRLHMLTRRRRAGERSDRFEISEEFWFDAASTETQSYDAFITLIDRALAEDVFGPDAAERATETRDFFAFMAAEIPLLLERWRATRSPGR